MINLSELKSDIKNYEIICPYCFDSHFFFRDTLKDFSYYLDLLKTIYNENPDCSNQFKFNDRCLNKGTKWCTECFNWICEDCSNNNHICNNLYNNKNIDLIYDSHHRRRRIYFTKNDRNISNICPLHHKIYLFYCEHEEGYFCENCEDCWLPREKKKADYSHGNCYFGPILYLELKQKINFVEKKIEESINFFNSNILKLYNDNKDKYENRKRFDRNFKIYRKKFISFLEFILLLIKSSKKITPFSFMALKHINKYSFEYKKFKYDKDIKNKSLKNYLSQLSNYLATAQFILQYKDDDNIDKIDIDLSKYSLKIKLNNFTVAKRKHSLIEWEINLTQQEFNSLTLLEFNKNHFIQLDEQDLKYKNIIGEEYAQEGEDIYLEFCPKLIHKNGNIYIIVNSYFLCIIKEIKKDKDKKIYKITMLKSFDNRKKNIRYYINFNKFSRNNFKGRNYYFISILSI